MLQKTDMALPGGLCFDQLEKDARAVVQAADIPDTGDQDLIPKVAYFAQGFRAITDSIGIKRDGEWGQRMHAASGTGFRMSGTAPAEGQPENRAGGRTLQKWRHRAQAGRPS